MMNDDTNDNDYAVIIIIICHIVLGHIHCESKTRHSSLGHNFGKLEPVLQHRT